MHLTLILIVLCCFNLPSAAQVPEAFAQWVDAQKKQGDFLVPFRMLRAMPTLKEPAQTAGRLFRLKDGRFRMEVGQPATSQLLFDGQSIHAWEGSKDKWHTVPPTHSAVRMWTLFLHPEQLQIGSLAKEFVSSALSQPNDVNTITLAPRTNALRRRITQIDLQVQVSSQRLLLLRVTGADQSVVTLSFDPSRSITSA